MEANTNPKGTSSEEPTCPFVFKGLGFFLMNEDAPDWDFDKERENPTIEESNSNVAQQSNSQSRETVSVSPDEHTLHLGEVMELSDDECVAHYNGLLGGDFPWERLNALVLADLEHKDMDKDDFKEWLQTSFQESTRLLYSNASKL